MAVNQRNVFTLLPVKHSGDGSSSAIPGDNSEKRKRPKLTHGGTPFQGFFEQCNYIIVGKCCQAFDFRLRFCPCMIKPSFPRVSSLVALVISLHLPSFPLFFCAFLRECQLVLFLYHDCSPFFSPFG